MQTFTFEAYGKTFKVQGKKAGIPVYEAK